MFYAVPPTIPPSGQFDQLSVTNLYSTGLNDAGFDNMPTTVDIMSELGLSTDDQSGKYVRYLTVYNDTNYNLNLSGVDWTFSGLTNIPSYYAMTFVLSIAMGEGWHVDALSISSINLD